MTLKKYYGRYKEYDKAYRKRNRVKESLRKRIWRENNREKDKIMQNKWKKKHIYHVRNYAMGYYWKRKKKGFKLTNAQKKIKGYARKIWAIENRDKMNARRRLKRKLKRGSYRKL